MPVLDGFQATREIRLKEEGMAATAEGGEGVTLVHHTPIIAMTANALVGDKERCIACGMDDYIAKPLRAAHLVELLQRTVS